LLRSWHILFSFDTGEIKDEEKVSSMQFWHKIMRRDHEHRTSVEDRTGWDVKIVSHYFRRCRELACSVRSGLPETAKNSQFYGASRFVGLMARRRLSDTALLGKQMVIEHDGFFLTIWQAAQPSFLLPHESPQETINFASLFPSLYGALLLADACRNEVSLLAQIFVFQTGLTGKMSPLRAFDGPSNSNETVYRVSFAFRRSHSFLGIEPASALHNSWDCILADE
jgi:hypothetical protein